MTPSGYDLATFRLVGQCLNQLRHHVLFMRMYHKKASRRYPTKANDGENNCVFILVNPLNTKRRLLYLKTQFVPRSKHFSSRL